MKVEDPHDLVGAVAEAVADAGRDEHERARAGDDLVALRAERERDLAVEDVERVVLVGVDVRLERAAGLNEMIPNVKRGVSAVRARNSTFP